MLIAVVLLSLAASALTGESEHASLRLSLLVMAPCVAGENLFLCGFRPQTNCVFDVTAKCQLVFVGSCSEFSSTSFQEFGLTTVYALVSQSGTESTMF